MTPIEYLNHLNLFESLKQPCKRKSASLKSTCLKTWTARSKTLGPSTIALFGITMTESGGTSFKEWLGKSWPIRFLKMGFSYSACIDTTEVGNLVECKVLTNFKDSQEYGTFNHVDMLNYTVRIMPENNLLQIVTDSGEFRWNLQMQVSTRCLLFC